MRRADREISDLKEIEAVIERAQICRLGLALDGQAYVVPMNFGYKDRCLYFHSASQGRKIEMLKANSQVCFELETDVEIVRAAMACQWGTRYACVIGYGRAILIENLQDKLAALDIIMRHYDPHTSYQYAPDMVARLVVIKVAIESMSGKRAA